VSIRVRARRYSELSLNGAGLRKQSSPTESETTKIPDPSPADLGDETHAVHGEGDLCWCWPRSDSMEMVCFDVCLVCV